MLNATLLLDPNRVIAEISPLLFGGFAEHMGRCVYEGIYDPASPLADEDGLRTDVLSALRELRYTTIRYPGGNFLRRDAGAHGPDEVGLRPLAQPTAGGEVWRGWPVSRRARDRPSR